MTNSKHTKRALLASVLSVVLCAAMLVSTTFAWFTDSVTSKGNIIASGTLDVAMEWADGREPLETKNWKDASTDAIFNYKLWEPGYTVARHIRVTNKGTLALKYQLQIAATGEVGKLAEVIDVYAFDNGQQLTDRANLAEENKIGTLAAVLAGNTADPYENNLSAGKSHYVTIALKMQETAGNDYQGQSIGSDFAIKLLATQYTEETDSFGKDYDADADWPSTEEPDFPVPGPGEEEKEVSDLDGLNDAISNGNPENPDRIFIELNNTDPINTASGNAAVRYLTKTTVIRSADGTEKVLSANDKTGAFRFGDKSFDANGVSNLYLDNVTIEAMKHENQNYTGIRLGSGTGRGLANKTINVVGGTFKTDCNEGSDQANASYRSGAFVIYNSQNVTINFTNVNFEFSDWAALVHEYDTAGQTNCANNTYNFINCTFTYVKSDGAKEVLTIDSWEEWADKYLPDGVGFGTDPISGMFRPTQTSNSTFNFS